MKILIILLASLIGMSLAGLPGALLCAILSTVLYDKVLKNKS